MPAPAKNHLSFTTTTTPSSGYVLSALVYNDGSDHDIKSDKSFIMPAHAVNISAVFEESAGDVLTLDFESAASSYTDWTITSIVTQQTNSSVPAHGGSYYGDTNGKTSGSIVTKNKIANPGILTFYVSKESTNTNASSVWKISVSSNGSSWTQVGDDQAAAASITRGKWTEVTRNLSAYSDVYVKIEYSGTTAVRCIDDISLAYN